MFSKWYDADLRLRDMAGDQAGHLPPGRHPQAGQAHADPALLPAQLRDAALRERRRPADRHEDRGPHRLPDHREHRPHLMEETLRRASVNMEKVFADR